MKLAGKVEPDAEKLDEFYEKGFDHFELYLSTTILDEMPINEIVDECNDSKANIATVHTPHINIDTDTTEYYTKSDEIANELDATLVFDSNPTSTRYVPNILPDSAITAPQHGYENDPSISSYYMRVNHLSLGQPLVLDTAHLHMSEPDYLPFIEELLEVYSADEIPVFHLADGTRRNDGVPFGEGTVDIESIVNLLQTYDYDGTVVLEVPQSHQEEALNKVTDYLDN